MKLKKLYVLAIVLSTLSAPYQIQSAYDENSLEQHTSAQLQSMFGFGLGYYAGSLLYERETRPNYWGYTGAIAITGAASLYLASHGLCTLFANTPLEKVLYIASSAALTGAAAHSGFKHTQQQHNLECVKKISKFSDQEKQVYNSFYTNIKALQAFSQTVLPPDAHPIIQNMQEQLRAAMPHFQAILNLMVGVGRYTILDGIFYGDTIRDEMINDFTSYANGSYSDISMDRQKKILADMYNHYLRITHLQNILVIGLSNIVVDYDHHRRLNTADYQELKRLLENASLDSYIRTFDAIITFSYSTFDESRRLYNGMLKFITPLKPLPSASLSTREQWNRSKKASTGTQEQLDAQEQCPICAENFTEDAANKLLQLPSCDCNPSRIMHRSCYFEYLKRSEKPLSCPLCRKNPCLYPSPSFLERAGENTLACYKQAIIWAPLLYAGYSWNQPLVRDSCLCAIGSELAVEATGRLYGYYDPSRKIVRPLLRTTGLLAGIGLLTPCYAHVFSKIIGSETPLKQACSIIAPILLALHTSRHIFNDASDPAYLLSNEPVIIPEEEEIPVIANEPNAQVPLQQEVAQPQLAIEWHPLHQPVIAQPQLAIEWHQPLDQAEANVDETERDAAENERRRMLRANAALQRRNQANI